MESKYSYVLSNLGVQLLHNIDNKQSVTVSPLALLSSLALLEKSAGAAVSGLLGAADADKAALSKPATLTKLAHDVAQGEPEFVKITVSSGLCLPGSGTDPAAAKDAGLRIHHGTDGVVKANKQVETETDHHVKELVKSDGKKAVLYSSMYMQAPFLNVFMPESTQPDDFHTDASHKVSVPFMSFGSMLSFNDDKDAGLRMMSTNFTGCNYELVVIVPSHKFGLAAMETKLTGAKLQSLLEKRRVVMGSIKMPRVKSTRPVDLAGPLQKAGFKDTFDAGKATLKDCLQGSGHLDSMVHTVSMDVAEFGSHIAPRELDMQEMCPPCLGGFTEMPEQQDVVANEPFLLAVIYSRGSPTLVSLSRVLHP